MDKNQIAIEVFDDCAQLYQDKYMKLDLYNDSFALFCSLIRQKGATILDAACGPGNITHYLLQQRPDYKILGTDLAPKMLELAQANNPKADFQRLDIRALKLLEHKFDGVICGFGLPYLSREEAVKFIGDLPQILHPKGVVYLSTMEDDYEKSGFKGSSSGEGPQVYIHYHEVGYLSETLQKNGFNILHTIRKDFQQSDGTTSVDLLLIATLI